MFAWVNKTPKTLFAAGFYCDKQVQVKIDNVRSVNANLDLPDDLELSS